MNALVIIRFQRRSTFGPRAPKTLEVWQPVQSDHAGTPLTPAADGHCGAKLYRVEIYQEAKALRSVARFCFPKWMIIHRIKLKLSRRCA